jgi:hypothetical protein
MALSEESVMRRLLPFACCLLLGCAAAPPSASVEGDVKLDGKPLAEGRVRLVPTDGTEGPALEAEVQQGSFTLDEVPPGTYLVQVYAPRKTGKTVPRPDIAPGRAAGGSEDEFVETIPPTYNVRSTLKRTITAGSNVISLELSSRPTVARAP